MAIIACTECEHKVSDQAASCPSCGAPVASTATKPRPWALVGVLLTLAVLGLFGSTLWHDTPKPPPQATQDRTVHDQSGPTLAVYQTTAEQLYQDYNTNGVATQTRIGNGRIRVSGKIASIEEDPAGHPVVKLATNHDHSAEMTLTDDQTAAAAQLARGQNVDIQCSTMRGINGLPAGSHCMLALVAAASTAAAAATGTPSHESPATIVTAVDAPHAAAIAARSTRVTGRTRARPAAMPSPATPAPVPSSRPTPEPPSDQPALVAAPEPESEAITSPAQQSTAVTQTGAPPAPPQAAPDANANAAPGSAAPALAGAEAAAPAAPDDLATVRAADPQAADHIASYCANSVGAVNGAAFAAGCRRDEKAAWTRLVLNNEFPALDDDSRRKCNEPPFPDSYTAKETCARYQLSRTSTSAQR